MLVSWSLTSLFSTNMATSETRFHRVQYGDIHLAGLARLLDEDGAEEEENVESTVLRSRLDEDFQ